MEPEEKRPSTKHTFGFPAKTPYGQAKAEALRMLRERGELAPGQKYSAEDATTDAHRNNPDGAERAVVIRVYE